MRVTFEHRSEGRNFVLYFTIMFSEEEKLIIQQRGLADKRIEAGLSRPPGSGIASATYSAAGLQTLARLCVIIGVILIPFAALKITPETSPFWAFTVALVIFVVRKLQERRSEGGSEERLISLKQIIQTPKIKTYVSDLAEGKHMEARIQDQLTYLKEIITKSTEAPQTKTIEI